jgi:hypothetical protein
MKLIKFLTIGVFALALMAAPAFAGESCCDKAKAEGKDCSHKCCTDAKAAGKACDKCAAKKPADKK